MTEKITQAFVLTPTEIALIQEKAREIEQKTGSTNNASAALRTIIREWAELTGQVPPTENKTIYPTKGE